ncbi:protein kinase [Pendulispora rubella]|uniref:Protein kinase n=1 Tax=Pendulispora rubella TaxID=2741070 RepID=A0ABZ2LDX4_9BACT
MQRDPFRFNGTVIDGQFRIDQWIGEGGFSNVYKGFHLGLNEPIAVKCLKPIADSPEVVQDFVNRFRDESRIAYRLSQGNLDIVRCIASGTTLAPVGVRVPYMVLEWLEGESLAIHFRGRRDAKMKGRSLKEAFDMFTPAGEAIVFAHSHGIVHRDIKPGNLFLTKSRQGGVRLKVLDFGMAKVMSDGSSESTGFSRLAMSMQNIAIFSPPYAAPEQFDPTMGPISAKVDVYSFALVFLEAMLDRRVRTGETDAECLIQACKPSQPITPRGLGLTVPDAVERLFTQACATNPRERPQSMEEFWGKLRNAMQADSKKPNSAHDDPQDWGDVADSIPPDADGPATIVADSEGLFDHEPPSAPPLPPIPGPAPLPHGSHPSHLAHHAHPQPHHAHASPHAVPHLGDDESTRTIDVNQLPSPPGQPPQQPIPPEVKDFLQRTGLAASARMPSPSAPSPQAPAGPGAKPFARPSQPGMRPSQPGGFHLPRPSIPRPEGSAGRLPAPLPAAGTPAEGVAARSDSANGRAAPRPTTGTTAMPIQAPRLPSLSGGDETGPSSSDMPTTVGQLNDMPIQGPPQAGGAARFDLASAETQFAPDAPAPFGAPPQQPPFFASPQQAPAGNPKNKTLALSATPFAQQFSNTPPVDPDAEAPTQAQFAPQLQDAMTYQPPPFAHPPPQPQHGGYPPPGGAPSPYGASGGTSAMPQFSPPDPGASPFGNYGAPGGGQSPFGAPGGGGGQYGPPPGGGQPAPQQQGMMQPGMAGAPPWQPQQGAPQGYAAQQGFAPPGPVPGAAPYAAQPQKPKLILIGLIAALAVILLIGAGYAAYSLLSSSSSDTNAAPSASAAPQAPSAPAAEVAPTPTGAAVAPQPPPEPPAPPPVQQAGAAPAQPSQPAQQPAAEAPHRSSGSSGSSDRGSSSSGSSGSGSGSSGSTSSAKSTGSSGSTTGSGPTPIARPSAGPSEPGKFSPEAARASLKTMEGVLASCKKPDGPTGPGRARVTFIGDGSVMSSVIVGPPYEGTPVGDCVATRFKFAKVPKFEGNPGVVDYNFTINK